MLFYYVWGVLDGKCFYYLNLNVLWVLIKYLIVCEFNEYKVFLVEFIVYWRDLLFIKDLLCVNVLSIGDLLKSKMKF